MSLLVLRCTFGRGSSKEGSTEIHGKVCKLGLWGKHPFGLMNAFNPSLFVSVIHFFPSASFLFGAFYT